MPLLYHYCSVYKSYYSLYFIISQILPRPPNVLIAVHLRAMNWQLCMNTRLKIFCYRTYVPNNLEFCLRTRSDHREPTGICLCSLRSQQQSKKLELYSSIKTTCEPEDCLKSVQNILFRKELAKLRISNHILFREKGRYYTPKIPKDERLCPVCSTSSV